MDIMDMFHLDNCSCGWDDIYKPEWFDTQETILFPLGPDQFITRAGGFDGTPVQLPYLNALVYGVAPVRKRRTAQAVVALLDMVVRGYTLPTDEESQYFPDGGRRPPHACAWEVPLSGVAYALADIARYDDASAPIKADDKRIVECVSARLSEVYRRVAQDMPRLLENGPVGDYRRNIALAPLHTLVRNFNKERDIIRDETIVNIVMQCWINTSYPHNHPTMNCLISLLYLNHEAPELPPNRHEVAVSKVGAANLLKHMYETLRNPKLLDGPLELTIDTMGSFIKAKEPLSRLWIASNIYDEILYAMKRQRETGKREDALEVYSAGYTVFAEMDKRYWVQVGERQIPKGALELAMHAMCEAVDAQLDDTYIASRPYSIYLVEVLHIVTCPAHDARHCPFPSKGTQTPAFVAACVAEMARLYAPTLRRLQASRGNKTFALTWLRDMVEDFPEVTQPNGQRAAAAALAKTPAALVPRAQQAKGKGKAVAPSVSAVLPKPSLEDLD